MTEVPTCYRHPERETYIRCARCDRPICPDCMISASVGFQCPECVKAGQGRVGATVAGGRIVTNTSVITYTLIAINVLVFLVELARGIGWMAVEFGGLGIAMAFEGEWYRLVTACFLHGSITHLLLNMYALFLVGPPLEQTLGRWRYLTLYGFSAIAGSVASYVFSAPNVPSVGASGAIFGLFGAYFVVARRLGREATGIAVIIAINVVIGFVVPNIDWRAHLGGLVAGVLVSAAFVYPPRQLRTPVALATLAGLTLTLLVLAWWRTEQLRELVGL